MSGGIRWNPLESVGLGDGYGYGQVYRWDDKASCYEAGGAAGSNPQSIRKHVTWKFMGEALKKWVTNPRGCIPIF